MTLPLLDKLDQPRPPALLVMAASAGVLGTALFFQYVLGLQPCILCIWQRWPYVVTFALGLAALSLPANPRLRAFAFGMAALTFLIGAGIAVFHVGVEQHWWTGTPGCGVPATKALTLEELRTQVLATPAVRCDQIPWSLFGISMAGYNVVLSLGLAAFAAYAARRTRRTASLRSAPLPSSP